MSERKGVTENRKNKLVHILGGKYYESKEIMGNCGSRCDGMEP